MCRPCRRRRPLTERSACWRDTYSGPDPRTREGASHRRFSDRPLGDESIRYCTHVGRLTTVQGSSERCHVLSAVRLAQSLGTGTSLTGVIVLVHRLKPGHKNL
jgi:hypothetical protein